MELLVMLLAPLPLGLLLKRRLYAYVTYIALHSFVFTFQTLALTRAWVAGSTEAFPADGEALPWEYAVVNLAIYAIGLGLVLLGARIRERRERRSPAVAGVDLAR